MLELLDQNLVWTQCRYHHVTNHKNQMLQLWRPIISRSLLIEQTPSSKCGSCQVLLNCQMYLLWVLHGRRSTFCTKEARARTYFVNLRLMPTRFAIVHGVSCSCLWASIYSLTLEKAVWTSIGWTFFVICPYMILISYGYRRSGLLWVKFCP